MMTPDQAQDLFKRNEQLIAFLAEEGSWDSLQDTLEDLFAEVGWDNPESTAESTVKNFRNRRTEKGMRELAIILTASVYHLLKQQGQKSLRIKYRTQVF